MADKVNILNIKFDKVDMTEAKQKIKKYLQDNGTHSRLVVTPNPEIVVRAQKDFELARILNQADLSVPDGGGIILASHILKNPLKERVPGFDLMKQLFSFVQNREYSIYLLGGKPGIARQARNNILKEYSNINICGYHHGYLEQEDQKKVISEINELEPDLLFVGMGVPLQEKFLDKNLDQLKVKVAMTVGGSFDIISGNVKRAPGWMQKLYLEWLYRLIKEPSRLGRMMALPRFVFLVLFQAIEKR